MGKIIEGIVPALVTPFDENGKLLLSQIPFLIRWLLDRGVNGFFVCGGTGEGSAMTVSERKLMGEAVVSEVGGTVPVILHVGGSSTQNAIELAKHAAAVGADGTASVAPIETPGDLHSAVEHYAAIGAASNLPFYVYWLASSADPKATAEQFLEAMQPVKNFSGFKFTDKNFYLFQQLVDCSEGKLNAVSGPDEMCLAGMVMGSDGAIGSTYNIMPRLFVRMHKAFRCGQIEQAMVAQVQANRVISLLLRVGVLDGIKTNLGWKGISVGRARPPVTLISPEGLDMLKNGLESLDFDVS